MPSRVKTRRNPALESLEERNLLNGQGLSPGASFNPGHEQQLTADTYGVHLPFGLVVAYDNNVPAVNDNPQADANAFRNFNKHA